MKQEILAHRYDDGQHHWASYFFGIISSMLNSTPDQAMCVSTDVVSIVQ
jgi:hypothetical protein